MSDFLTSIIQDSRPREQAGMPPGGADEAGPEILRAGGLGDETTQNERHGPVSAESGQIPFSPITGPDLAAPPPLRRRVWSPTTLADAGLPVVGTPEQPSRAPAADPLDGRGVVSTASTDRPRANRPGEANGGGLDSDSARPAAHAPELSLEKVSMADDGAGEKASASPTTSSIDANATRFGPGEPDGAIASTDRSATSDRRSEEGGKLFWPLPLAKTGLPRPMDATGADRAGEAAMTDTAPTVPVHGQSLAGVGPREQEGMRHGPPPAADAFGARPVVAGPKVRIGRVDVTVTAPAAPNVQAPRFGASHRINRQYLRRV